MTLFIENLHINRDGNVEQPSSPPHPALAVLASARTSGEPLPFPSSVLSDLAE